MEINIQTYFNIISYGSTRFISRKIARNELRNQKNDHFYRKLNILLVCFRQSLILELKIYRVVQVFQPSSVFKF